MTKDDNQGAENMNLDNFTGRAEAYVIGRPSYPKESIDFIENLVSVDSVFVDIGAGTGKFTSLISTLGNFVYAVEPNDDMRGQLESILDSTEHVRIVKGTAEMTTLSNHCCDVITIAHALHWFDLEKFKSECIRILKPDGLIIVIYNHIPGREYTDNYRKAVNDFFENNYSEEKFLNETEYTREKWLAYIYSQDDSPKQTDASYMEHLTEVNKTFDSLCKDGVLSLNRMTAVYYGKLD